MIGSTAAKQEKQAWVVLAGAAALCLLLAFVAVPDESAAGSGLATETQGQLLSELIRTQRAENQLLTKNLSELKQGVGFTVKREFEVTVEGETAYTQQPGLFFHDRRNETIQKLDNRAHDMGIQGWDKNVGFAATLGAVPPREPPPNEEADNLLLLLQVTKRVVSICLATPNPLIDILVVPHGQQAGEISKLVRVVAPPGRPPLFREYTVTLKLKGSLSDILWVVHRLSPGVDETDRDFPLVLKSFTLTSENVDLAKPIPQLSITLTVAGLSFLSDKERAQAAGPNGRRPGSANATETEGSKPLPAAAKSF